MRTSYSAISTYLSCPQKYKFQDIDKRKAPKSREALFGTLVHNTLQYMFKSDPLFPTLDEVLGYYRDHWPAREIFGLESKNDPQKRAWTEEEEKIYFEDGVRMLKRFYASNAPWNFTVVDLEAFFQITLTDDESGEVHVLAGKIDRIDKHTDGTYEIIDYKTGKRMPTQEDVDKDLQLSLYALGLQKRWPHLKANEINMSLSFLKHGEKLGTKFTDEKAEETKKYILENINSIQERVREGKEFEPMPSPLCNWCGYRPICPAWKHLYKKGEVAGLNKDEIDETITEYFKLQQEKKDKDARLKELQIAIRTYMDQEGVTRVFGDEGYISKKMQQRFSYDMEKIKTLLSPLGKWEEIQKADETKLKKLMAELPTEVQDEIQSARELSKEFSVLTASKKKPDAKV